MISSATYILFIIATFPRALNTADEYCRTICLPEGHLSKMLCFESFDYAICAYKIVHSNHCWQGDKRYAQKLLDAFNQSGEFKRCGYNLDPSSETGFSFDQSRSDLVPCYALYIPKKTNIWGCGGIEECMDNTPNTTCRQKMLLLNFCVLLVFESGFCIQVKDIGRKGLLIWKTYQEEGYFRSCGLGYDPVSGMVLINEITPKNAQMKCYSLSGDIALGISYSTNGQVKATLKGKSWSIVVAVAVIASVFND
ncbi:uncharacterized protein LOC131944593 [Physella acuta]|uniref:uncharacterized protein LOC131944593 n=1 Tax=Physella acuta TaxID=109671 RepID=UPI0027DC5E30|nr:uncharacterized protein LOC131944593 [Physella acuta]